MMTAADIADHNRMCAKLTAEDGIPRLTWEQHGAVFAAPVTLVLVPGQLVAAWDSSTPGTVGEFRDDHYDVRFPHVDGDPCRYNVTQLRPWPFAPGVLSKNAGAPDLR